MEKADKLPPEAVAEVPEKGPDFYQKRLEELEEVVRPPKEYPKIEEKVITIKAPEPLDGFRVTAINGEFGEYNVTKNPHWFEFDSLDNKTRISMRQEDLGAFINELIRAANFLGVSVG